MSKKTSGSKINRVVANLVATYDLSTSGANSVLAIDYLCVYEYEYKGKKYKYRTHQKDTFTPIPETIELGFKKDPSDSYKINNRSLNDNSYNSSGFLIPILIWGIHILGIALIIYFIYNIVKYINSDEFNIFSFLFVICLFIIAVRSGLKKRKYNKKRDELIEDAILNNRIAMAYLINTKYNISNNIDNSQMKQYYKEYSYSAKYKYYYNGKNRTKTFDFIGQPPTSIKLYFHKNHKKIIYWTFTK